MSESIGIIGKECANCHKKIYPARLYCPNCRNTKFLDWRLPREGTIYSFTTVNFPLSKYDHPPYHIGLIQVENGSEKSLVTARLRPTTPNREIMIGQKVKLDISTFEESGSLKILVATPN
jgi:uncharacterized OB-fold protein